MAQLTAQDIRREFVSAVAYRLPDNRRRYDGMVELLDGSKSDYVDMISEPLLGELTDFVYNKFRQNSR